MLQFRNETGLAGTIFAAPDPDGVDSLFAIVKGTFALGHLDAAGVPFPAEEQLPPVLADEHHADPGASSIRVPADVSLLKRATDVLLAGTAYAPAGRPAQWLDVSVTVGPLRKIVRVFGDRYWVSNNVGYAASSPQPFESVPLVWERAFGGVDQEKDQARAESRNPVGAGFRAANGEKPLDGLPLPNLEDPYDPIRSWKQLVAPAAFAPVAPSWEPRRSRAGTYDEAWLSRRAPYLPTDFDERFFQLAPEGLVAPGYLQGGEVVEVTGATPAGQLRFRLPAARIQVDYRLNGGTETRPANLDTVLIEPDLGRLILVWRAALACDKKLLKVREITARLA